MIHNLTTHKLWFEFLEKTATDAVRKAEYETKRRQNLMIPINALNGSISTLRAEICKLEDKMAQANLLKRFFFLIHYNKRNDIVRPSTLEAFENVDEDNTSYVI